MKKLFYIFLLLTIIGCKELVTEKKSVYYNKYVYKCSNSESPINQQDFDRLMSYIPDSLKNPINKETQEITRLFQRDSLFSYRFCLDERFYFGDIYYYMEKFNDSISFDYEYTLLTNDSQKNNYLVQEIGELIYEEKVKVFFEFCHKNKIERDIREIFSAFYEQKVTIYYPAQFKHIEWLGFQTKPKRSMELWVVSRISPFRLHKVYEQYPPALYTPPIPYKNVFILYDRKSNEMVEMVVKEKKDSRENELLEDSIYHYFYVRDKEE